MVNFGQILLAQALPEWRYVNYEALKTLIEEKASLSDFEEKLQAELFEVDKFYETKEIALENQVDKVMKMSEKDDEKANTLFEATEALRKYVLMNYMAVVKIVKKRNKNFPGENTNPLDQIGSHVFYTSTALATMIAQCDKLKSKTLGSNLNALEHCWVFDGENICEGTSLLNKTGLRQRKNVGIRQPTTSLPKRQNTVVIALEGCRVDQLLLAHTPNMDDLLKMSSIQQSEGAAVQETLEHLFNSGRLKEPTFDTYGTSISSDSDTLDRICKDIRNNNTKSIVHLHLNQCVKTSSDPTSTQDAIEDIDSRIARLQDAFKRSDMDWSVLVCTDSSATTTKATSNLMVMAPAVTPRLGAKAMDIEDPEAIFSALEGAQYDESNYAEYTAIDWVMMCVRILCLFALLYVFVFGLDLMGTSFKVLGGVQAGELFDSVDNPIAGLMVGILATVLVQSSSTSTSVVVSMVGADIISVEDAIPVIMGANIGTSVTNTIVSLGQMNNPAELQRAFAGATVHDCFNLLAVVVMLPLECATNFLYYMTKEMSKDLDGAEGGKFKGPLKHIVSPLTKLWIQADKKKINKIAEGKLTSETAGSLVKGGFVESWSDEAGAVFCLIVSLVILCLALFGIVKLLQFMVLGKAQFVIKRALKFSETWWGGYLSILVGVGVTIAVQSSSITTSTLTPLVGVGVITVKQMYPLTLGANIGTTCTAFLAALVSEKASALQIALCHFMFNVIGIFLFYPIPQTRIPIPMCKFLGEMVVHLGRWFPLAYLVTFFFLTPLVVFGITAMFTEGGSVGAAFGIIVIMLIVGSLGYFVFWWNFREGRQKVIDFFATSCAPVKGSDTPATQEVEDTNPVPKVSVQLDDTLETKKDSEQL